MQKRERHAYVFFLLYGLFDGAATELAGVDDLETFSFVVSALATSSIPRF